MAPGAKSPAAFRTIGELSREIGVPQHVLRYWETRFPQLRPLTRAGNRRYYRAEDVALVLRIDTLLNQEGYTIRGVQQVLASEGKAADPVPPTSAAPPPAASIDADDVRPIRDALQRALREDAA